MDKFQYLKELIHQLEKRHTFPDNVLLITDIIIESVEIGIRQNNTPTRQAEIITQVIKNNG